MTPEERAPIIESYGAAYELLVEGLKQFPTEMWDFRPSPDDWTIHEIIIHIADADANSFIRGRRFIAEPGLFLMVYDENKWVKNLNYARQSTDDALQLFRWLRHNNYQLVKNLSEETWAHTEYHSDNGLMTMDDWLRATERHVPNHLQQMAEIYQVWQTKSKTIAKQ